MKRILIALVLLVHLNIFSQSFEKIDSLSAEICKSLEKNKKLSSDAKFEIIKKDHLVPYLSKINDTVVQRETFQKIFFRLQKNCSAFGEILQGENENKSDWQTFETQPEIKLTKEQNAKFDKIKKFSYKEFSGSIVYVTVENGFWIEKFEDGTFSKLQYVKTGIGKFEIEFVESNNESRKNFSKKGDKYFYQIFGEKDGVFDVYISSRNKFHAFKLYPVK